MARKLTGTVDITVGEELLLNKAGAVANNIGKSGEPPFEKTAVIGDSGVHGHIDTPVEPSCEVTITDSDQLLLDKLARIEGDATLIFSARSGGKVYTLNDVFNNGIFTVTAGEGEVAVKFVGSSWTEALQ